MSFFLNTKNAQAIADFMESVLDFLPTSERAPYHEAIERTRNHEYLPREEIIPLVHELGQKTWPPRHAMTLFLQTTDGAKAEWTQILERCRAKTAAALKKLRTATEQVPIDQALRSADAAILIDGDMDLELSMIRPQIRQTFWQEKQKNLLPFVERAKQELDAIEKRLKMMREEAARSRTERELINAKVATFEDRVYFGGESLPTDMLDTEIQFEREERAIPTTD